VRLPEGARARKVRLLAAAITPRVQRAGGELTLTIPTVVDHEVVAIDL